MRHKRIDNNLENKMNYIKWKKFTIFSEFNYYIVKKLQVDL